MGKRVIIQYIFIPHVHHHQTRGSSIPLHSQALSNPPFVFLASFSLFLFVRRELLRRSGGVERLQGRWGEVGGLEPSWVPLFLPILFVFRKSSGGKGSFRRRRAPTRQERLDFNSGDSLLLTFIAVFAFWLRLRGGSELGFLG